MRDNVSTFEELEALLLLVRAAPHARSALEVATELRLNEELAQSALDSLLGTGSLLERTPRAGQPPAYRYVPAPELRDLLEQLESTYREEPLTVVKIMSANALERVRSSAARRLAEAFRLERSKK